MDCGLKSGSHKYSQYRCVYIEIFHVASWFATKFLSHVREKFSRCGMLAIDVCRLCGHTVSWPSMDSEFSAMSATSLLVLSELSRKFKRFWFVPVATSLFVLRPSLHLFATLQNSTLSHFDSSLSMVVFPYSLGESNLFWLRFSESPLVRCLPIRQLILHVPKIGITFHRICPPTFIQTWLQHYSRGAFLYSAHCSFSNPICFRTARCWRTMISG